MSDPAIVECMERLEAHLLLLISPPLSSAEVIVCGLRKWEKEEEEPRRERISTRSGVQNYYYYLFFFYYCAKKSDPGSFFVSLCLCVCLLPWSPGSRKKKISFFLFRLSQRRSGRKKERRTKYNGIDRPLGSVKEGFFFRDIEGGCVCWYIQRWRTWWKTIVFSSFVDTQLSTRRIPFSI